MSARGRQIRCVTVYCASSRKSDGPYLEQAQRLGLTLARHGITILYGGGSTGLMGCMADAALAAGGKVVGFLPHFMSETEFAHPGLTELRLVDDMHERKRHMLDGAEGVVALPGGCGTLEELLEAITWKRLGLVSAPIVLVNVQGFFDPCLELFERSIAEGFMDERDRALWTVVDAADEVIEALERSPT